MTIKEAEKLKKTLVLRDIIVSAIKLGIKVELFSKENNIYCFKYKDKVKYFKNTSSVFNVSLASKIATNKRLTQIALRNYGIKTARGYLIDNEKDLKTFIKNKKIKFPIVIKPNKLMEGTGVCVNINNIKDGLEAINNIKKIKKAKEEKILVENYFYGRDYRLLVLKNTVIAATERIHPSIIGDGKSTIEKLIKEEVNKREKLKFDKEIERSIKDAGYKIKDRLEKGKILRIRQNANYSTGALAKNVTDKISPYFKKIAIKAIKALGLGIGGVDILTKDIIANKGDYIVVEINGCPNPDLHINPSIGKSINVPMLIVKKMFNIK